MEREPHEEWRQITFSDLGKIPTLAVTDALAAEELTGTKIMEQIRAECPEVEVRAEQVECLDAIQARRNRADGTVLVHMAPGLGKLPWWLPM